MEAGKYIFVIVFFLFFVFNCDRKRTVQDSLIDIINCQIVGACGNSTRYGMVGDSWTDLIFGYEITRDLYDQLVKKYHYQITHSNLAGLTLQKELEVRRGFLHVIRKAGPNIQYMLLSLGGNDFINGSEEYYLKGFESTISSRTLLFGQRLKELIVYGNQYKQNLYGGEPLKWIIHGYDYPNPELDISCVIGAYNEGMPIGEAKRLPPKILDRFNETLRELMNQIPFLYFIDLRKTLGGPPYSKSEWMTDCLHPNTAGFDLITENYVQQLHIIERL